MKLKIKSNLFYVPVLGQKENVRIDNIAGDLIKTNSFSIKLPNK